MAKLLTSRLVPGFSHNLRLVVLGRCSLYVSMKFQDKFARLRQLNSPNSEDKFKNVVSTCINFDKISGEFRSILLFFGDFHGISRKRNFPGPENHDHDFP